MIRLWILLALLLALLLSSSVAVAQQPIPRPTPMPRPPVLRPIPQPERPAETIKPRSERANTEVNRWANVPSEPYVSTRLRCPVPYRVEVTSEIPAGWSPSFQSITNQRSAEPVIRRVGSATQLVCYYGSSGSDFFLYHPIPPEMPVCRTSRNGFECRPDGPFIHAQGELSVAPSQTFDLDSERLPYHKDDFWSRADSPSEQVIDSDTNIGGTRPRLARVDRQMTPQECRAALESGATQSYPIEQVRPGTHVCYQTTSGRVGQFEVLRYEGRAPYTLVLRYTTWVLDA